MNSLERMNYVVRHDDGNYALGPRLLYLGKLYEQSFHLSGWCSLNYRPYPPLPVSASWYVLEGGQRLCLFRAEASHGLRHSNLPGTQFPLDDSAISKVLRHWGLNEPLPGGEPALPLYTAGARDPHTAAFAMPVFGVHDKLIAALALTGPISRLTEDRGDRYSSVDARHRQPPVTENGASKPFCQQFYGETSDTAEETVNEKRDTRPAFVITNA